MPAAAARSSWRSAPTTTHPNGVDRRARARWPTACRPSRRARPPTDEVASSSAQHFLADLQRGLGVFGGDSVVRDEAHPMLRGGAAEQVALAALVLEGEPGHAGHVEVDDVRLHA